MSNTMKTREIGKTGLKVTEISFGGAAIGGLYRESTQEDSNAALQAAWDSGARMFDTAPRYGAGLSERRIGDFIRSHGEEHAVISTKVGRLLTPVSHSNEPRHGFVKGLDFDASYDYSYDGIMRSVEMSYARTGLNYLDILFVHDIGNLTHGTELGAKHFKIFCDSGLKAMQELKSSGAIKGWGLGVNEVPICLDVMAQADMDCILLAGRYTLLDRSAQAELLAKCASRNTSLVIGGVFNSGILATGITADSHFDYEPASADIIARVKGLEALATEYKIPLAAAAMQFTLRNPIVATVLIGTSKASSFTRNIDLLSVAVPGEFYERAEQYTLQ